MGYPDYFLFATGYAEMRFCIKDIKGFVIFDYLKLKLKLELELELKMKLFDGSGRPSRRNVRLTVG